LPGIYPRDEYVAAGGVLAYSPDRNAYFRRAAEFVHRIAQGARPADMPVEQPAKYELIVNLRAAAALGLKMPASIMLRADRVIE
jgi:putative tryptophan/tyrosine transport system substrate-binding protein